MKCGIYMGPGGQLVEVFTYRLSGAYQGTLSLRVSESQSFWLSGGYLSPEMVYLLDGWEYLGPI